MSISVYPSTSDADPWIEHAKRVIFADYGVNVSLEAKNKDLLKFGRNRDTETEIATLMTLPDTVDNETYVATNLITSIISTSAADGETVTIEGHTVASNVFTFVSQTKTLTGQTVATLGTALGRVTRIYNSDVTTLAGTISVCEDDTYSSGVPDTAAGVHCQIFAGEQQSEKASTTLSSADYWVITSFYADMLSKSSGAFAEVDLEVRLASKVFRPVASISCSDTHRGSFEFKPYIIVPPNADIRLRAISDSGTGRDVSGGIEGSLLKA